MMASRAFGISLRNAPDQRHGVKARQGGRQRDRDVADGLVPVRGQIFLGLLHRVQDATAMLEPRNQPDRRSF
jgi:hypothetical protein